MAKKRPKIVSSANGKLNAESWDKLLRHKVWDKVPEHIDANKDVLYMEFGVWKGSSANFFVQYLDKLYAFDSFEGLKEDWVGTEATKNHFNSYF